MIRRCFHLWRREVASYFQTGLAFVAATVFWSLTGIGFWMWMARLAQEPVEGDLVRNLFGSGAYWLALLTVIPLLTMRLFAEEHRQGTLELLLTAPVTETEIVWAKFAAAGALYFLLWAPTLAYGEILALCGARLPAADWGAVAAAYLGTLLIGAFFLSVGLLSSLLIRPPAAAAMVALAFLGLWVGAGGLPHTAAESRWQQTARIFSAPRHLQLFAAGIVDSEIVVWYVSATALMLFFAIRLLEARRLR